MLAISVTDPLPLRLWGALTLDEPLTEPDEWVGTPCYTAPEVLESAGWTGEALRRASELIAGLPWPEIEKLSTEDLRTRELASLTDERSHATTTSLSRS